MKSEKRILIAEFASPAPEFLAAASASETMYRVMLEQAPDAIFILNSSGRYVFVNEKACEMLGCSREELLQLFTNERHAPYAFAMMPIQIKDLSAGKSTLSECYMVRKDQTQILVEMNAKMLPDGHTQCFVRDITARKQMQHSTADLAAIVQSSEDAIIGKSLDGIITSWNSGAVRLYGYSASEMIGKPISLLVPPDYADEVPQILHKICSGEYVDAYETMRRRKDGQIIHISLSVSPIRDSDGHLLGASTIARDIPALTRAEASLHRYVERLAAINRLERITSSGMEIEQIYDNFVKESLALIPMDRIAIVLLNESGDEWQIARQWTQYEPAILPGEWRPVVGSVMEWLVTNQMPFVELEIKEHAPWPEMELLRREGMQSNIVLPLIVQKQVVGGLIVANRQPLAFSEEDQTILTAIADQLAIAIHNAHLFAQVQYHTLELEQVALQRTAQVAELEAANNALEKLGDERTKAEEALRRYAERLAAINRLERITSSGIEIEQIYNSFVKELIALISVDRTSIVLLNESGDEWQIARQWTRNESKFLAGEWRPVAGSAIEWLVTNRMPLVELEVGEHTAWPETEILRRDGIRSRILFPLMIQGQVIGALTVANHEPTFFSEEDQSILTAVADQLAIAIHNAHLRSQVQDHTVELERRVLERTTQLEAANSELEAFSYSVSHDLRAPLRGIDGYARIVLRDYAPLIPADGQRRLQSLREMTQRMGTLIDDLLTFSRLNRQAVQKRSVDMGRLVKEVLEDLKSEFAQRQTEIVIRDLASCQADPTLLKQVLVNLLSNALKYTRPRPVARIEIGTLDCNGVLAYFVRDNGVGFDMQYANKLFGVFQRLHRMDEFEGTGVGLAIVQRIIHRHGGSVWAEAALDAGACFFFTVEGGLINDGK